MEAAEGFPFINICFGDLSGRPPRKVLGSLSQLICSSIILAVR